MSTDLQGHNIYDRNAEVLLQFMMKYSVQSESGDYTLDSRLYATKLLKKEHKYVTQAIGRNKERLERRGELLRREDKIEGVTRGRPEVYYQLTERQMLILLSVLATGDQRDILYDALVDAFLILKKRTIELEARLQIDQQRPIVMIGPETNLEQLFEEKLEEKLEERMQRIDERFDMIEQKITENSPKTILKHSFGKAKLSDLK
jgi:hypothetical protein